MVDGEVRFCDFDFKKVLSSGQMKSAGFGEAPQALFEKIGDVFRGESLEEAGILDGSVDGISAVDFTEGDDFVDVMAGVETAFFHFTEVILGLT